MLVCTLPTFIILLAPKTCIIFANNDSISFVNNYKNNHLIKIKNKLGS